MPTARYENSVGIVAWLLMAIISFVPSIASAFTITYNYDAAGRLTNALYSNGQRGSFAYDDTGNITGLTTTGWATPLSSALLLLLNSSQRSPYTTILDQQ